MKLLVKFKMSRLTVNNFSFWLIFLTLHCISSLSLKNGSCKLKNDFHCGGNVCVTQFRICDGERDCPNGSDERNCSNKDPQNFTEKPHYKIPENGYNAPHKDFNTSVNSPTHSTDYDIHNEETIEFPESDVSFECASTHFRCLSGGCIDDSRVCDGFADCSDKSDESTSLCAFKTSKTCSVTEFQCTDGGCIPAKNHCDRIKHCKDGSDEGTNVCGYQPVPETADNPPEDPKKTRKCRVPEYPPNGKWLVHKSQCGAFAVTHCPLDSKIKYLDAGAFLVYSCDQDYTLVGDKNVVCSLTGEWIEPPKCVQVTDRRGSSQKRARN